MKIFILGVFDFIKDILQIAGRSILQQQGVDVEKFDIDDENR